MNRLTATVLSLILSVTLADEMILKRGACIDSKILVQTLDPKVSNYHCEASPYYCAAGEEWWDSHKTAKEGLYCNFSLLTRHNKLHKEPSNLTWGRTLSTHTTTTKLSDNRILQVNCNDVDLDALNTFRNSMDGGNWTNKWENNEACCAWEGVECVGDRVHTIKLVNNNLSGMIPDAIGNLSELVELNLGRNHINGTIPNEVGKLKKLRILKLNKNELSGELPTHLGKLSNLKMMFLGINSLTGEVPCHIWSMTMTHLTHLALQSNQLIGPIRIGDIHNCTDDLRFRLPKPQLRYVDPDRHDMQMPKLKYLDLSNNTLTGDIPTEFGRMKKAKKMYLGNTNVSGAIPTEIGRMKNMKEMYVSDTNVSGIIPTQIGKLRKLRKLWLTYNNLNGAIPTEIGKLTKLTIMNLSWNDLSGTIPTEIGKLVNLPALHLGHNYMLTGSIPTEVCALNIDVYVDSNIVKCP